MHVTVAICTWNRSSLLAQTLERLTKMQIPPDVTWELLVVENRCTDDTVVVAESFVPRLPIRVLAESQTGLSHARNRAMQHARGELLLWTDDDVLVSEQWLAAYVRAARDAPNAAFFGGPVLPWWSVPPPKWAVDHQVLLCGPFATTELSGPTRPFSPDERPVGANMAFRAAVQREFPYDTRIGRKGNNFAGGEEDTMLRAMQRAGYEGVWVEDATVSHYIVRERLTWRYLWNWFRAYGAVAERYAAFRPRPREILGAPRWAVATIVVSAVGLLKTFPRGRSAALPHFIALTNALGAIRGYRQARAGRDSTLFEAIRDVESSNPHG